MKINLYQTDSTPSLTDKVIGTDVSDNNITKNYMLGDVKTIFDQNLQSVLDTGNTSTTEMTITSSAFSTITNLYTGILDVATSLIVDGTFVDSAGVTNDGTKVLGSTATGSPLWVTDSDSQNLQSVLDFGNTSTTEMTITSASYSSIELLGVRRFNYSDEFTANGVFIDSAGVTNDGTKVLGSDATGNPLWVADSDKQNLQSVLDFGNVSTTKINITSTAQSNISNLISPELTLSGLVYDSVPSLGDGTKFLGTDASGNALWKNVTVPAPGLTEVLNTGQYSAQEPGLGIGNFIQVKFGNATGTASDPVMMDALGNITFNETGTYFINSYASIDRLGANGGVAIFLYRLLLDGVQVGFPIALELDRTNISIPEIQAFPLTITTAGTVLKYEIARTGTVNAGGLYPYFTSTSWGNSPSASIKISKLG